MAAEVNKSFNKNVGTNRFGPRATRELGERSRETPGPGGYRPADPLRPTCEVNGSARGRPSGSFASTARRDTSSWTGATPELD